MLKIIDLPAHILCVVTEEELVLIDNLIDNIMKGIEVQENKYALKEAMHDVEKKTGLKANEYSFLYYGEPKGELTGFLHRIWPRITWKEEEDKEITSFYCDNYYKDITSFLKYPSGKPEHCYNVQHQDFKSELNCILNKDYSLNLIVLEKSGIELNVSEIKMSPFHKNKVMRINENCNIKIYEDVSSTDN